MEKEILKFYLYISWDNKNNNEVFNSYMKVSKTIISEEINCDLNSLCENVSLCDNVFMFSSFNSFDYIKKKLVHYRFPYLLIDITLNLSTNALSMYLDNDQLKYIEDFIKTSKKNNIYYLEEKMNVEVENENYELAAKYRDYILKEKHESR